jgi:hypothetical protein
MTWSGTQGSAIFREWPKSIMGQGQTAAVLPAAYAGLGADAVNVALYTNTGTPDKDAAITATGYNTGQWSTSNQTGTSDTNWAAVGRTLASKTFTTPSTGVFMFDAADLAGGGSVTLAAVYGCLVYDDTITVGTGGIADQGDCFNYFGGSQSVTAGTFTVVWNANGIARFTV